MSWRKHWARSSCLACAGLILVGCGADRDVVTPLTDGGARDVTLADQGFWDGGLPIFDSPTKDAVQDEQSVADSKGDAILDGPQAAQDAADARGDGSSPESDSGAYVDATADGPSGLRDGGADAERDVLAGDASGDGCTPVTCAERGFSCGATADQCGKVLDCGICTGFCEICDPAGQCTTAGCCPSTCKDQGLNCGPAGDGCGGLLNCGTCPAPEVCGGGGAAGQCGPGGDM
jgi:hypothetical protein